MGLKTRLVHTKIILFGDKTLELKGKSIPCKKCEAWFMSYTHHTSDGGTYDSLCIRCEEDERKKEVC